MNGKEFIRRARKLGRKSGLRVVVEDDRGKGGHKLLIFGGRRTIVPTGEIGKGLLHEMCRQIGIHPSDL